MINIAHSNSIKFLRPMNERVFSSKHLISNDRDEIPKNGSNDDIYYTPMYASGSVISPIMMESMMAAAFHQPCMLELYNSLCGVVYEV
jgi:hypothetical protein